MLLNSSSVNVPPLAAAHSRSRFFVSSRVIASPVSPFINYGYKAKETSNLEVSQTAYSVVTSAYKQKESRNRTLIALSDCFEYLFQIVTDGFTAKHIYVFLHVYGQGFAVSNGFPAPVLAYFFHRFADVYVQSFKGACQPHFGERAKRQTANPDSFHVESGLRTEKYIPAYGIEATTYCALLIHPMECHPLQFQHIRPCFPVIPNPVLNQRIGEILIMVLVGMSARAFTEHTESPTADEQANQMSLTFGVRPLRFCHIQPPIQYLRAQNRECVRPDVRLSPVRPEIRRFPPLSALPSGLGYAPRLLSQGLVYPAL